MTKYTWIYSFSAPLSEEGAASLSQEITTFLAAWKSHGADVHGKAYLKYDRFLILQSDPSDSRPSGCSIDSMKKAIEEVLQHNNVGYEDASQVFFKDNAGVIRATHFHEISSMIESGDLGPDTIVYDHTLSQTDDLSKWEVPLSDTWLSRFLTKGSPAA
jgi:hypothetical protein